MKIIFVNNTLAVAKRKCKGETVMCKLNEQDIHCITRVLQSVLFTKEGIFYGCKYCQHYKECSDNITEGKTKEFHFNVVRKKLQAITRLHMEIACCGDVESIFQKMQK